MRRRPEPVRVRRRDDPPTRAVGPGDAPSGHAAPDPDVPEDDAPDPDAPRPCLHVGGLWARPASSRPFLFRWRVRAPARSHELLLERPEPASAIGAIEINGVVQDEAVARALRACPRVRLISGRDGRYALSATLGEDGGDDVAAMRDEERRTANATGAGRRTVVARTFAGNTILGTLVASDRVDTGAGDPTRVDPASVVDAAPAPGGVP